VDDDEALPHDAESVTGYTHYRTGTVTITKPRVMNEAPAPTRFARTMTACFVAVASFTAWAQAPKPPLAFEVASIRQMDRPSPGIGTRIDGARADFGFVSLTQLLPYAFQVKYYQISAPSWTSDTRWSIQAKLPDGAIRAQVPEMMRTLLAARFQLTYHHEQREQQVYELTLDPGAPKPAPTDPSTFKVWDGSFPGFGFGGLLHGDSVISGRIIQGPSCSVRWEFVPLPMSDFADALARFLGQPVSDQTGLKGTYAITLDLNEEAMAGMTVNLSRSEGLPAPGGGGGAGRTGGGRGGPEPDGGGRAAPRGAPAGTPGCPDMMSSIMAASPEAPDPTIIKAVQKNGLKLQRGRAPIDTIVIDHLDKTPTDN
jgi:uncharacterized protein (TIGR03435 family)